MPFFELNTNVSRNKITAEFIKATAKVLSDTLQKPVENIVIQVNPDQLISFGNVDTVEPCGFSVLKSIGRLGIEENKKHTTAIHEHLNKALGIPIDRLKIQFVDLSPSNIGFGLTTLYHILHNL